MPAPDPAATVLLLRPASEQFEVLMVERNSRGFFGSMVVFPGGSVDAVDVPTGSSAEDDVSHRNAAIRELAEETGLLVTCDGVEAAPGLRGEAFYRWLRESKTEVGVDSLVLVSRWVTPEEAPRRFDARFYLMGCSSTPEVYLDTSELVGYRWTTPATALANHEAGQSRMILPTLAHLRWLDRRTSIDDALRSANGADGRTLIEPRRVEDGSLVPVHLPAESA